MDARVALIVGLFTLPAAGAAACRQPALVPATPQPAVSREDDAFLEDLSRRTFIRGVGVTMSLPFLDAMVPARTLLAQTAARPQIRLGLNFIPHGAVMNQWTPATTGALELSPILSPLSAHKDQVVVLSNLAHAQAGPQGAGDNGGDHTRCPAANRKIPLPASGRALCLRAAVSAVISSSRRTGLGSPSGSGTIIHPGLLPRA